ncbi:hypothetical protein BDV32DRAFT_146233 [Aspergillus pseudonomiae]|nr:hypothetical protein BDV32DRAFT_146233 [Aspergillus pseudonomiae]
MPLRFDKLPLLVLYLVFDYIRASAKTLCSLALVNHACNDSVAPFLYRNLEINIYSPPKLLEDLAKIEESPRRKRLTKYVRHLKILGCMHLSTSGYNSQWIPVYDDNHRKRHDAVNEYLGKDLSDGSEEDISKAWTPLAEMIQKCQHLRELIWVCPNQLPPCILKAVQQCHPACHLEMRFFLLRSLRDAATIPHELDLVQSRCLHSITMTTVRSELHQKPGDNEKAIFEVITLAPNIKHLNVIHVPYRRLRDRTPSSWKGFVPPPNHSYKGALVSLSYFGRSGVSVEDIAKWSNCTDMSKIRYLRLGGVSDPQVFEHLTQSVKSMSLDLLGLAVYLNHNANEQLLYALECLLEQLIPLKEFSLRGCFRVSILDKLFHRHGPTLRKLDLYPLLRSTGPWNEITTVDSEVFRTIQNQCPILESLTIYTPNSAAEVLDDRSLQRVCPSLPYLYELELCVAYPYFSMPEGTPRKIWDLIERHKRGCRLNRLIISDVTTTVILSTREGEMNGEVESLSLGKDIWEELKETKALHGDSAVEYYYQV